MSISIIIVTYQRTERCQEAIRDLVPMLAADSELIIVEQCSSAVAIFCNGLGLPQIRCLNLPNPSMVGARNAGITAATKDLLLFLDDDVIPLDGLIEGHESGYSSDRIGGVAGRILSDPREVHETSAGLPPFAQTRDGWDLVDFRSAQQGEVYSIRGCNMSFRRDLLIRLGGFDTHLRMWRDDADMGFRVWEAGYRIIFEPSAALIHLDHASGGTRSNRVDRGVMAAELAQYARHYRHYRDNLYFLCRHFSGSERIKLIARAYRDYVGISRWPWRLIAKNLCFLTALAQANRLAKAAMAQAPKPLQEINELV